MGLAVCFPIKITKSSQMESAEDDESFYFYHCFDIKELLFPLLLSKMLTFLILDELYPLHILGLVFVVGHEELKLVFLEESRIGCH